MIFVLEEECVLRDALVAYLAKLGFAVSLATGDRREFQRAALANPPRVVLMELVLGDRLADPPEGLRVLEWLRLHVPRAQTIVLTSCTRPPHLAQAMELGAMACLEKHRLPASTLAALLLPLLRELRTRSGSLRRRRPDGAGSQG